MKLLLLTLSLLVISLNSQEIVITDTRDANYPEIEASYLLFDNNLNINATSDLSVFKNGSEVASQNTCPIINLDQSLSSILAVDVSGSMKGERLSLAKSGVRTWVEVQDLSVSEVAITSFSDNSYIIQDFTNSQNLLDNKIDDLITIGGTSYINGIYGQQTSPSKLAEDAKFKPIIVFLTDGTSDFEYNDALTEITNTGSIFYAISLRNSMPKKLKDLATATGGLFYENVETKTEIRLIYKTINFIAKGGEPCTIKWETAGCALNRVYQLRNSEFGATKNVEISVDPTLLPKIEIVRNPIFSHGLIETPNTSEVEVEIKANGFQVNIDNITTNNEKFEILDWGGPPAPFTLEEGDSRVITTRFTPTGNEFQMGTFIIESDACSGGFFYQTGGDPKVTDENREIQIIAPNGGEKFEVGSDQEISWQGTLESEKVCIEYSTDNGETWTYLAEGENGNFNWNDIPDTPSENCLARITLKGEAPEPKSIHIKTDGLVSDSKPNKGIGFMKTDPLGNIYFAGYYLKELDIEGAILNDNFNTRDKIFIAKFDKDLNLVWIKDIEKSEACTMGLRAFDVDLQGNAILGGFFTGGEIISESGPNLSTDGEIYKFWIGKFDSQGNELNIEASGGSTIVDHEDEEDNDKEATFETIHSIETDEFGLIYVSGVVVNQFSYQGTVEVLRGSNDLNLDIQFFVAKLNPDLDLITYNLSESIRPEYSYLAYKNQKLALGINYLAVGLFNGKNNTEIEIPLARNTDFFLMELNTNLEINQGFEVTGRNRLMINDLAWDENDNLTIAGSFVRNMELPTGKNYDSPTPDISTDLYLMKFNGFGPDDLWHKSFGSNLNRAGEETARSIDINSNGDILFAGTYVDSFTFEGGSFENANQETKLFTMLFDENGNFKNSSAPDKYQSIGTTVPYECEFVEDGYLLSGYFINEVLSEPTLKEDGGNADIFITKQSFNSETDCSNLATENTFGSKYFEPLLESESVDNQNQINWLKDGEYDNLGNKYIAGMFYGSTVYKDQEFLRDGRKASVLVSKLDNNDDLLWVLDVEAEDQNILSEVYINDIEVVDDYLYIVGFFNRDLEFRIKDQIVNLVCPKSDNDYATFITKMTLDGEIINIKTLYNTGYSVSHSQIEAFPDGNIALISMNYSNPSTEIFYDGFEIEGSEFEQLLYIEVDDNLNYIKHNSINTVDAGLGRDLTLADFKIDNNEDLIVSGQYLGTFLNTTAGGLPRAYLLKVNRDFDLVWLRYFENNINTRQQYNLLRKTSMIELLDNDDIIFGAMFINEVTSVLNTSGNPDISFSSDSQQFLLLRIDTDGEIIWENYSSVQTANEEVKTEINALEVDKDQNIYIGFNTNDEVLFLGRRINSELNNTGQIIRMSANGNFLSKYELKGLENPDIYDIENYQNNLLINGSFYSAIQLENGAGYTSTFPMNRIGYHLELSNLSNPTGIFDVSDNLWEIYKNQPVEVSLIEEVDMGIVGVGDKKEKIEEAFITVNSNFGTTIESVDFPDSERFTLVTGLPISLEPQVPQDVEFSFSPDQIGFEESVINLETSNGGFTSRIFGNGVENNAEQLINPIDFGQVSILTQGKTLVEDVLRNKGLENYDIDEAQIIGPDREQFFLDGISTNSIPGGEVLSAELTFLPIRTGKTSSILALVNSLTSKTWYVDLYGEGVDLDPQNFEIYTNELEAETGDLVMIPIYISDIEEIKRRGASNIYTELSFNESLIYPYNEDELGETYGRRRTIPLNIDISQTEGNLVAEIPMLATLGDEQATDLDLANSTALSIENNSIMSVIFDETDGEFRLSDICWDGGGRFVTGTGQYTLEIMPNPIQDKLTASIGIIENGVTTLAIYNASGELVERDL